MIRLTVLVDLHTNDLETAYRKLYDKMTISGLSWESGDEWYDHEGTLGSVAVLNDMRSRVLGEHFPLLKEKPNAKR